MEYHFSKYKRKYWLAFLDKYYLGRVFNNLYLYQKIKSAKSYDRFIVLTEEDKKLWYEIPNIEAISNPLPFIPDKCSDLEAKRVIAVGRYTHQKGFDHLIYIWAEINKKHPDWKLAIYGDGSKKKNLQKLINKLNLGKVIELIPPQYNIEQEYLKSSVFVMTSRYEGISLVLMEAMSCGLPAVAFSCMCGPKDIIKNGYDGFITPYLDRGAFAEKLLLLIEDEELRKKMGKAASMNIKRFREEIIMPKWIELFRKTIGSSSKYSG